MFICVLNTTITEDNVKWYQLRNDQNAKSSITSTPNNIISFSVVNTTTSVLTIHNLKMNHNGFYWIEVSNFIPCNTSLTVLEGIM